MKRWMISIVGTALVVGACTSGSGVSPTQTSSVKAASPSTVPATGGIIVFGMGDPGGVYTIAPDGTGQRRIVSGPCCPRLSPDGSRLVVTAFPEGMEGDNPLTVAATLALDGSAYMKFRTSDPTLQVADVWAWSPDGARIAGEGFDVTDPSREGIYTFRSSDGGGMVRVTDSDGRRDGVIAYSPNDSRILFLRQVRRGDHLEDAMDLFVVKTNGTGLTRLNPPGTTTALIDTPTITSASWSPDGRQVAFIGSKGSFDINDSPRSVWVVNADGTDPHPITEAADIFSAQWSPDGRWIALNMPGGGPAGFDVFVVHPDGSGLADITESIDDTFSFGPVWSPDSTRILFVGGHGEGFEDTDLWTVNVDGTAPFQLTQDPGGYNSYSWARSPTS
jgi:Tol biopolymer transport system component